VSLEKFISSLGGDRADGEGRFTVDARRAERLLKEKALSDPWLAWRCLLQGLYACGPETVTIKVTRSQVLFRVAFEAPLTLQQLMENERFLLAWLNLDHFGEAHWEAEASELRVDLSGFILWRYRTSSALTQLLSYCSCYAAPVTLVNGETAISKAFPVTPKYTFFQSAKGVRGSLRFPRPLSELGADQYRLFGVEGQAASQFYGAIAFRTRQSWSQVRWVSHGVVIKEERNTLERPGLIVIASVESLGLNTDLSGFSVVHDDAYHQFVSKLKKEVLWML